MKNLCPDICKVVELPKELNKELCPQPKQPEPKQCTMIVTKVSSNNVNLQNEKTYNKVCSSGKVIRHTLSATEIFKTYIDKDDDKIPTLCEPCEKPL